MQFIYLRMFKVSDRLHKVFVYNKKEKRMALEFLTNINYTINWKVFTAYCTLTHCPQSGREGVVPVCWRRKYTPIVMLVVVVVVEVRM